MKKTFLFSLIITIIIVAAVLIYNALWYNNMLKDICEVQHIENSLFESNLFLVCKHIDTNTTNLEQSLINKIQSHNESIELVFERLASQQQRDFELLSLWAGIITIVFLVFSIYSTFRTDEMLSKANTTLDKIKDKDNQAEQIVDKLKDQQETHLRDISQKIATIENQAICLIQNLKKSSNSNNSLSHPKPFRRSPKEAFPRPTSKPNHPLNKVNEPPKPTPLIPEDTI